MWAFDAGAGGLRFAAYLNYQMLANKETRTLRKRWTSQYFERANPALVGFEVSNGF
ncbi:hypothetical protein AAKU55_004515, partial [Oxalobacteraceae bacterium GrIS 1.11]